MTTELAAPAPASTAKRTSPTHAPKPQRVPSLDAYRGFVMLAMVSSGLGMSHLKEDKTWGWLAHQMEHLPWEGCTFWDLIQPSFMFIVGAAMPFAFALRRERGESWGQQFGHALRRSLTLIAIGVFLDCYAEQRVIFQLIRVLQQIAIGYLLAFLVLGLRPYWQLLTAALILVVHTLAFLWYGWAVGGDPWAPSANVGTALDELLRLPLSKGHYVTLNALSSTATILFGVLAGELLRGRWSGWTKFTVLVAAGVAGLVLGSTLGLYVPMVKRIWTASFAVYAAGWTCLMLAAFYLLIDVRGWRGWAFPFVVVGANSIAIYVAAGVFRGNVVRALNAFLAEPLKRVPEAAPVILSLLTVFVLWLFCYWLYRHRIFFKV